MGAKTDLKPDRSAVFESTCHHRATSSHRTALALPIRISSSLLHFPSFVNSDKTTSNYLSFSTCCSAAPCIVLGYWWDIIHQFFMLTFITNCRTQRETDQSGCSNLVQKNEVATKRHPKTNGWFCSFQRWLLSTQLWLSIQFISGVSNLFDTESYFWRTDNAKCYQFGTHL